MTNSSPLSIPACVSKTSDTFSSLRLDITVNYKYLRPADLFPTALNFDSNKSKQEKHIYPPKQHSFLRKIPQGA